MKALKIFGYILLGFFVLLLIVFIYFQIKWYNVSSDNIKLLGEKSPILKIDNQMFRDLNKNRKLDTYEDFRQPISARVEDLLSQMTIEEKAGAMFITMIGMQKDGGYLEKPDLFNPLTIVLGTNSDMVARKKMNHFNIVQSLSPDIMAKWNNNIQEMAERTRLGIPVTIATDPRHAAGENPGANIYTETFSHWPSTLGLAATRDSTLVQEFGDIARQEYLAVGIRVALHPMADLATEPRWGRINGTFGEDAHLSKQMTQAYILGFQGDSLDKNSVACMTKHFSGGGPQKDGEDPHFPYGKEQVYPGDSFTYHLIPFEGAFKAKTAQIMPYYGIPVGQTNEDVGFSFNKTIITTLLREKYGFDGIVCTDWSIITDNALGEGRKWGVEDLTDLQRVKKVIDAGCDMFGGEKSPDLVVELVKTEQISEARIDESIRRILRDKFILGLFDNPYLDEKKAVDIVGRPDFVAAGKVVQRKSLVLLKNESQILPLARQIKIYVKGMAEKVAKRYGEVVKKPEEADFILLKLQTPYEKRDDYFLEPFFHQGRLYFDEKEKKEILDLIKKKPTITVISLERPALIPDIAKESKGLIVDFNTEDDAIFDIIFGDSKPQGKLPFTLPSTQESIEKQFSDVPFDLENPLYPFGFGLTYDK